MSGAQCNFLWNFGREPVSVRSNFDKLSKFLCFTCFLKLGRGSQESFDFILGG